MQEKSQKKTVRRGPDTKWQREERIKRETEEKEFESSPYAHVVCQCPVCLKGYLQAIRSMRGLS